MTFPNDELDVVIEIGLNNAWIDITNDVLVRDGIQISRGLRDEATRADPARCTLSIKNNDGKYSPRNPSSPYFGLIGRNTPLRVSVNHGSSFLDLPDTNYRVTSPDSSEFSITGDIDIRIDVSMDDWRANNDFCAKYVITGDQRSWQLYQDYAGTLWFTTSADGVTAIDHASTSVLPIPASGRQAIRVTMDANNGSSGHTVTFYTAPKIEGPWTQLGNTVVTAGATSLFDSTAQVEIGDITFLSDDEPIAPGKVYAFELRNGIDGDVVASPYFTDQTTGVSSFSDDQGNVWTMDGATISNKNVRFVGEVSSWPPRWDVSGNDVWVPIEAAGILRRIGQGTSEDLRSPLYRGLTVPGLTAPPVAYWPCEDSSDSTELASAIGGPSMTFSGEPTLSSYSGFVASEPIPVLNDSEWNGNVPTYESTGEASVRFLLAVPTAGNATDQAILNVTTSGTATTWIVWYDNPSGGLSVTVNDSGGSQIYDSTVIPGFAVNGKNLLVALDIKQVGSDVEYDLSTVAPAEATGQTYGSTLSGRTMGQIKSVRVNPGGGLTDTSVGHIYVQKAITSIFDIGMQLGGYLGESAGRRIERLCDEENIPFTYVGSLDDTAKMGVQPTGAFLDLLSEAADVDMGLLHEPKGSLGIRYRTRASLYNQDPTVELDYEAGHLSPPLEPVDDDQNIRNDVTVTRKGGSSARAVATEGPLSSAPYPSGVGSYKSSVTLNLSSDTDLLGQARWRLLLGTIDEARYPQMTINLASPGVAENFSMTESVIQMDVGDRMTLDNQPSWIPPDPITQLVMGYSEFIGPYEWLIASNCSPESPYRQGTYDSDDVIRYDTGTSVVVTDIDESTTSVDVYTSSGPLWTTSDSDLPFDVNIGGEKMTVTAISEPVTQENTLYTESFETGSFPFSMSGYMLTSAKAHTGAWSVDAANLFFFATEKDFTIVVPSGATTVEFWYAVNTTFRFYNDGVLALTDTGNGSWEKSPVFSVTPGKTLRFNYANNSTMFIDDIRFAGPTAPIQTFTVVRSANGVQKSHVAGTNVSLWRKSYYAL